MHGCRSHCLPHISNMQSPEGMATTSGKISDMTWCTDHKYATDVFGRLLRLPLGPVQAVLTYVGDHCIRHQIPHGASLRRAYKRTSAHLQGIYLNHMQDMLPSLQPCMQTASPIGPVSVLQLAH